MEISFKLSAFEGPLDLLLHLIEKNKIDIYDIPISVITEQYLEYISGAEEKDADLMSDFLVMAVTLLDIKAKMLLPIETDEEGNEEDPRAGLVQKLLEYKLYKYMSYELKDLNFNAAKSIYKGQTLPDEVAEYDAPIDLDFFLEDVTASRLKSVFDDVMIKSSDRINEEAMKFGKIERDEINVDERLSSVREFVKKKKRFSFRQILGAARTRANIVVTFLVILELMRTGEIRALSEGDINDVTLCVPSE